MRTFAVAVLIFGRPLPFFAAPFLARLTRLTVLALLTVLPLLTFALRLLFTAFHFFRFVRRQAPGRGPGGGFADGFGQPERHPAPA
jgi:hypothetical protein